MDLCKDCGIKQRYFNKKTNKTYSYCTECQGLRGIEARKRYNSSEVGKEKIKLAVRRYQRKKNGFSPELFDNLLIKQNYMCAICSKDIDESSHADHNHATGLARGILCPGCNTLLGRLERVGFSWVDLAKEYLKKYE